MQIKINGKKYEVNEGETVLEVCRRNGIRIPTLCHFPGLSKEQVCRLCLVETNRSEKLVTSCGFRVCEGLEVKTESERIEKARKINLELLWADHAGRCATCKKNRRCELQNLAEEYKIENFHFVPRRGDITSEEELDLLEDNLKRDLEDNNNPCLEKKGELCVECRRCIQVCPTREFGFNYRSGDVKVETPYGKHLDCIFCGQCVKICPTASLSDKNDLNKIVNLLDDVKKQAVAIVDPTILDSVSNEFEKIEKKEEFIGLLREIGFEKVFDLSWGFHESAKRQSLEIERNNHSNLILSHCSALIFYIEKYFPEMKKNILETEIPDELMAKSIKSEYVKERKINSEDLVVISISSCVAKKKMISDNLDFVLTMREVGRIARIKKINEEKIKKSDFDKEKYSLAENPSGLLNSGQLSELIEEQLSKEKKQKIAKTWSVKNIKTILEKIKTKEKNYNFCELMICPGACQGGGGKSIKIKEK